MQKNEFVLFGLENTYQIIDTILMDLECSSWRFDIKLMLMEGLNNAFVHGNQSDVRKPIWISYERDDLRIRFKIKDSGDPTKEVTIPTEISEEMMLQERGRGLFIIQAIADKVSFRNSTLIIEKTFNSTEL